MSSLSALLRSEMLRKFSKLTESEKQSVLLGEEGHRILMVDIEATSLKPNVGRIICCSFKPLGGEVYTFSALDRRFKKRDVYDDSALAAAIRDEMESYDIVCGWNSKAFDYKFVNARCLRAGERIKRAGYHIDGMWSWRSKSNAWSGLAAVQQFIDNDGPSKTTIDWRMWMRVLGWDKELREGALAEIVHHCELDVVVLERAYRHLVEAWAIRSVRKDGGVL